MQKCHLDWHNYPAQYLWRVITHYCRVPIIVDFNKNNQNFANLFIFYYNVKTSITSILSLHKKSNLLQEIAKIVDTMWVPQLHTRQHVFKVPGISNLCNNTRNWKLCVQEKAIKILLNLKTKMSITPFNMLTCRIHSPTGMNQIIPLYGTERNSFKWTISAQFY